MDNVEKKKIKVDRSISRKLLKIAGLLGVLAWICLVLGAILVFMGLNKELDFDPNYILPLVRNFLASSLFTTSGTMLIESSITLFIVMYILKGLSIVVELSECKKAIIEDEYKIEDLY